MATQPTEQTIEVPSTEWTALIAPAMSRPPLRPYPALPQPTCSSHRSKPSSDSTQTGSAGRRSPRRSLGQATQFLTRAKRRPRLPRDSSPLLGRL